MSKYLREMNDSIRSFINSMICLIRLIQSFKYCQQNTYECSSNQNSNWKYQLCITQMILKSANDFMYLRLQKRHTSRDSFITFFSSHCVSKFMTWLCQILFKTPDDFIWISSRLNGSIKGLSLTNGYPVCIP